MIDLAALPFIQSAQRTFHLGPENPERKVNWLVLHTVDDGQGQVEHVALSNAHFFMHGGDPHNPASAHYFVDGGADQPAIHTVQMKDIAFAAPGANTHGVHIEHAGSSAQSAAEWSNDYARAMLELSAQIAAAVCSRFNIPPVWLSPHDLLAGKAGITSHNNVTIAFKPEFPRASHTDPGPNFPSGHYVERVKALLEQG